MHYGALLSGSMSGSFAYILKWKSHLVGLKNKITMIIPVRVHPMQHQNNGHMTNYQKWSKIKVVALHCSFQNQLEFCSKVLLLLRYEVINLSGALHFFLFFVFFSMKTKLNNMISTHLES
jgi:hypothetical protein